MDTYEGRLVCDGFGNLLADEGDNKGLPVAHDVENNTYVFVSAGEPSHNERHHAQFAEVINTTKKDEHHLTPLTTDPHYDEDAPNKVRISHHPDRVAKTVTGHTNSWN
jgi:hypothetical protein